jgi:hypothetical protein
MIILLVFGYKLDLVVDLFTLSCTDNSVLCFIWDLNIALLICKTTKLICQFHVHIYWYFENMDCANWFFLNCNHWCQLISFAPLILHFVSSQRVIMCQKAT